MLELSSSMRAMARPPSSPKSSSATPNHVTTERPNGTLQHTLIATLSPLQPETYERNNTARLDARTDVRPCSHIRVPLESAAYRLAAGGTNFNVGAEYVNCCKTKGVTAQHFHTPCPVSATVTTAPRNNRSARAGQLQALSSLNSNFLRAGSLRCSAATASCTIFCSPASISGALTGTRGCGPGGGSLANQGGSRWGGVGTGGRSESHRK